MEPDIKQEPGLHPNMVPGIPTDSRSVAAARASQALQKNYGNRATSSINAIQAGMTAQAQGLNGHNANPQGYPQNPPGHLPMPQTDGADEAQVEGVLMNRNADGEMVEMGRFDIDRMLHEQIMAKAKSMEGGGFMVPLQEAIKHPSKVRRQKKPGIAQVDGEDEDDEDAINSDLDDTDDDREDSDVDDDGLSHMMLCMYDKVQRVRNKWYVPFLALINIADPMIASPFLS